MRINPRAARASPVDLTTATTLYLDSSRYEAHSVHDGRGLELRNGQGAQQVVSLSTDPTTAAPGDACSLLPRVANSTFGTVDIERSDNARRWARINEPACPPLSTNLLHATGHKLFTWTFPLSHKLIPGT